MKGNLYYEKEFKAVRSWSNVRRGGSRGVGCTDFKKRNSLEFKRGGSWIRREDSSGKKRTAWRDENEVRRMWLKSR